MHHVLTHPLTHTTTHQDWIAVCLATVVLALQIADEVRDITLCELSGYELNSMQDTNNRRAKFLFQVLICVIRRYCILPCLCASAFVLITYRGGDAMSVSLNTVALVFILQCDDLLYEKCVDLRVRADADKVQSTIKEMDQPTLGLIAWTKVAHVVAVPSTTLAALLVEKYHTEGTPGIGVYDGAFVVGLGMLIVGLGESQVQKRVDMSGGRVQSFLWAGFKGFLGALVATSVTTTH